MVDSWAESSWSSLPTGVDNWTLKNIAMVGHVANQKRTGITMLYIFNVTTGKGISM